MQFDFDTFFKQATGNPPFPYQHRLATGESLPQLIDAPTGAGKTAAAILGWLWRRRFANEDTKRATPRRLVYCLPMRVLVEQTVEAVERWLANLGLQDEVRVYILMGGEEAKDWDVYPERDAILIGTQDMLLSRALNRGYGMSRYRWPMHFGLLNNDCLWVLDEIQLMGSGLATTTQLQAFREKLQVWGTVQTIWMSATLQQDWLATVDFKDKVPDLSCQKLEGEDREDERLRKRLQARKPITSAGVSVEETESIASLIKQKHQPGTLTLVVINTVDRARKLYDAIRPAERKLLVTKRGKRSKVVNHVPPQSALLTPLLLHSRFRPYERQMLSRKLTLADKALRGEPLSVLSDEEKAWIAQAQQEGLIVIATQVIEAGVDISAKTLFTELAPWASLVQRFGRCNRFGEDENAQVYWIDVPTGKKNLAEPYEDEELEAARNVLEDLTDVGIVLLEKLPDDLKKRLLRYESIHVVRRKDIVELFDTTPDLAGNDIDISRFIRDGRDLDVQVFWREVKEPSGPSPKNENGRAPWREELCSVPFYKFKDFLKDKEAFRWDVLEERWIAAEVEAVFPGQLFLIPTDQGGYDVDTGWEPKSGSSVKPLSFTQLQPPEGNDDDFPSLDSWQTIAGHTNEVVAETLKTADALGLNGKLREAVELAARWHDRGKAHHVFQDAIHDGRTGEKERPEVWRGKRNLAKAPSGSAKHGVEGFWKQGYSRKHFRHELATGLAMLQASLSPLAAYLAASHHGKVRLSIRSLPDETHPDEANTRFARGVWDGDTLAVTDLGDGVIAPEVTLSLEPMELGIGQNGQPSWAEQILRLRDNPQLGLFKLAFLEAILRAADWRASDTRRKREEERNA